ncbi:hypothetical protein C5B96_00030 [Subtercola sp. Z020]|uniref:hypothetical protein n=1 Tax=Subtercola sp. Z020 TaxID=2080582 RepID=UPI000CE72F07|nr:hypothetical protein [Subtercola sp. Z020]PPF90289.1 hypothetical protein C5B96_00030 [Subtercola sp. Z020]
MSGELVFVDETKARDYLVVAVAIATSDIRAARSVIRQLTLPGQPRLHMKKENESRKRQILDGIVRLQPSVTVYRGDALLRTDLARRERCLRALVADCVRDQRGALLLERDETIVSRDRQWLIEASRDAGAPGFSYRHESASSEPLLAIPDALAWAWARGGDWRRRCTGLITGIVDA